MRGRRNKRQYDRDWYEKNKQKIKEKYEARVLAAGKTLRKHRQKPQKTTTRVHRRWTSQEDSQLWSGACDDVARLLGRTVASVLNRRMRCRDAKPPKKVKESSFDRARYAKEYYQKHKEKRKAYYMINRERILQKRRTLEQAERQKSYRKRNPDKYREYARRYYETHKIQSAERSRDSYHKNRDSILVRRSQRPTRSIADRQSEKEYSVIQAILHVKGKLNAD